MDRTYIMVKPDGVQRGLIGDVIHRFESKGFQLLAAKMLHISRTQAEKHYAEHVGRPYFEDLVNFITSGPVMAMVWGGDQVVPISRMMIGKTNTLEAQPGTIRGDHAIHTNRNIVHGSDSPENAEREIAIFFTPEEIMSYEKVIQKWI